MDLIETLRTTGSVRQFTPEPVPDEVVARVLDTARFAPSGGNRQGWRVVVVRDPAARRRLRDLYLAGWHEYLALGAAGLTPWSPTADREAEARALAAAGDPPPPADVDRFPENLDRVPVLLAVLADLRALAAVDRDRDRYTFAGGASVYPFVWSLLLAARAEGLAGVLTTVAIRREDEVKQLLGAPHELALAAVVALGHPVRRPRRLTRAPVESFATWDRLDGPPLTAP
ncbi:MAG TPA: nitroreductase family protein [Acidimicrobiales bacterium]